MITESVKTILGADLSNQVEAALKGKGKDGKDVDLVVGNDGTFVPADKYNGANSGKTSAENALKAAAVTANQIAEVAEFFSFGTNDLTQMTLGFSRDDIGKFLPIYLDKGILKNDPFQILDQNGVGQLIREAVFKGRGKRPMPKCGICGEHGGEPSSVEFCHYAGLNYVSCSPFRVPIARLAAAHAALKEK